MAGNAIENPALVQAIDNLKKQDTPENRQAYGQALASAKFLAPVHLEQKLHEHDRQADGSVAMEPQTNARFLLFTRSDGKKIFPAFTDWDQLHKWQEGPCQTMILDIQQYSRLIAQQDESVIGVALNPMSQNLTVPRQALLASNAKRPHFDMRKPVQIGTPKNIPQALVDILQEKMVAEPAIREAWLKIMMQNENRSWLLVISTYDKTADIQKIGGVIAQAAVPQAGGMPISVVPYRSPLGQQAAGTSLPVYIRG